MTELGEGAALQSLTAGVAKTCKKTNREKFAAGGGACHILLGVFEAARARVCWGRYLRLFLGCGLKPDKPNTINAASASHPQSV